MDFICCLRFGHFIHEFWQLCADCHLINLFSSLLVGFYITSGIVDSFFPGRNYQILLFFILYIRLTLHFKAESIVFISGLTPFYSVRGFWMTSIIMFPFYWSNPMTTITPSYCGALFVVRDLCNSSRKALSELSWEVRLRKDVV